MKRFVRILIITGFLVASLAATASTTAAPPTQFRGVWQATDIDGSNLRLFLAGGGDSLHMIWLDDNWSICDGDPGFGLGHGTIDSSDPDVLHASITFTCAGAVWGTLAMDFTYDPATDTLVNSGEGSVTWSRAY